MARNLIYPKVMYNSIAGFVIFPELFKIQTICVFFNLLDCFKNIVKIQPDISLLFHTGIASFNILSFIRGFSASFITRSTLTPSVSPK